MSDDFSDPGCLVPVDKVQDTSVWCCDFRRHLMSDVWCLISFWFLWTKCQTPPERTIKPILYRRRLPKCTQQKASRSCPKRKIQSSACLEDANKPTLGCQQRKQFDVLLDQCTASLAQHRSNLWPLTGSTDTTTADEPVSSRSPTTPSCPTDTVIALSMNFLLRRQSSCL
jgi:hypothetical protein